MFPYIHIILPSYLVCAYVGGFFMIIFLYLRKEKFKVTFREFKIMLIYCILGGFIGSKILFVISQIPNIEASVFLKNLPEIIITSGYVFYGGLFGVLLGLYFAIKRLKKHSLYSMQQMIAPALPLFHGFGRIGCMLAGCCYGLELQEPLVLFDVLQVSRFPTQFIESVFEFLLFFTILLIEKKKSNTNLLMFYLFNYAIFRFCIEFYRDDSDRGFWIIFSTSQWISLFILIGILYKIRRVSNLSIFS